MSVLTTSGLAEHVHVPPATALLIKAIGFEHLHCRNLIYIYNGPSFHSETSFRTGLELKLWAELGTEPSVRSFTMNEKRGPGPCLGQ